MWSDWTGSPVGPDPHANGTNHYDQYCKGGITKYKLRASYEKMLCMKKLRITLIYWLILLSVLRPLDKRVSRPLLFFLSLFFIAWDSQSTTLIQFIDWVLVQCRVEKTTARISACFSYTCLRDFKAYLHRQVKCSHRMLLRFVGNDILFKFNNWRGLSERWFRRTDFTSIIYYTINNMPPILQSCNTSHKRFSVHFNFSWKCPRNVKTIKYNRLSEKLI